VEFFELPLPDRRRLRQIIDEVVVRISKDHTLQRKRGAKGFDTVVESLRGLTEEETERALSQALVTRYALCPEIASDVLETKKSLLRRSEMLEFVEAGEAFTGQPKTVAYSEARFVGRLGTRVRTGTTARRNHSRGAGMREVALRTCCGGRVEPAAGKV
jgi:2-methylcitrate dehydratase PrpD